MTHVRSAVLLTVVTLFYGGCATMLGAVGFLCVVLVRASASVATLQTTLGLFGLGALAAILGLVAVELVPTDFKSQ